MGLPMTDLAANEPLNAEEEARVRDFYERRTTRLNMGPSVLIPRLLATLDAARLLADTPSVEPECEHEWEVRVSTSGGTVIPSPSRTMGHAAVLPDARWECAKCGAPRDARPSAELAELSAVLANVRGAVFIHLQRGGYCIDCGQQQRDGHGDDCAVARFLNDPHLTVRLATDTANRLLPTQASDSPEKP